MQCGCTMETVLNESIKCPRYQEKYAAPPALGAGEWRTGSAGRPRWRLQRPRRAQPRDRWSVRDGSGYLFGHLDVVIKLVGAVYADWMRGVNRFDGEAGSSFIIRHGTAQGAHGVREEDVLGYTRFWREAQEAVEHHLAGAQRQSAVSNVAVIQLPARRANKIVVDEIL